MADQPISVRERSVVYQVKKGVVDICGLDVIASDIPAPVPTGCKIRAAFARPAVYSALFGARSRQGHPSICELFRVSFAVLALTLQNPKASSTCMVHIVRSRP